MSGGIQPLKSPSVWLVWGGLLIAGVNAALVASTGDAWAQYQAGGYRAGSFVDGQPVFSRPRRRVAPPQRTSRTRSRTRGRAAAVRRFNASANRFRSQRSSARQAPAQRFVEPRPTPAGSSDRARVKSSAKLKVKATPNAGPPAGGPYRGGTMLQLVISRSDQRMTVYRGDRPVEQTRVSTGKSGHQTPTGLFSIIQKRRWHRSNIYSGAPMPFMQRITWSGIALHLGVVPNYPASHGCIRLPASYAERLFGLTAMRTHVVVADGNPVPRAFAHSNLPVPSSAPEQPVAGRRDGASAMASDGVPEARGQAAALAVVASNDADDALASVWRVGSVWRANYAASPDVIMRHDIAPGYTVDRKETPLRILVTRRSPRDQAVGVQRRLLLLGYDAGDVDGYLGSQTVAAIRALQTAEGLDVTGLPNEATRARLAELTHLPWPSAVMAYVRQDGEQIFAGPVELTSPEAPVGTHYYALVGIEDGKPLWTAMTLQAKGRLPGWTRSQWRARLDDIEANDAKSAIDRVRLPPHVRRTIEQRLTVGSSLIIADSGSERETGQSTDFVVLTD